ncbi:hypothetical protein BJ742DRAFT_816346 [Cladochytrium replicatum]|nr:hypothetical protein BJ742DRAFT_816346 [Cladochytrium replicatum]
MDESVVRWLAAAVKDVQEALSISEPSFAPSQPTALSAHLNKLSASSNAAKYRTRATRACDRCYNRKIRCLGSGSDDPLAPCKHCQSAGVACTYGQPEYRRSRKKTASDSVDKNSATKSGARNERDQIALQAVPNSKSMGSTLSDGGLGSHFLQLLTPQMASGGSADELKSSLGLNSMCTSHGTSYLAMPETGTDEITSSGPRTSFTPAHRFPDGFNSEPFISFGGQQSFNFHRLDSSFLSPLCANLPQIPSTQTPTPLLQSPTPIIEPPQCLLSRRQKDELIDAYFNFINPSVPFLHPGHFWNEYRAERVPVFLLDAIFGVSIRYMNPRVKAPDSFGMSLYTLSRHAVNRSESHSLSGSPSVESEASWSDLDYEEYVKLGNLLRDRAFEWFSKLKGRRASMSLVHTMILLLLMESSRAGRYIEVESVREAAIRSATSLNLNLDLPGKPFEVNTRRRTWWCLVILEVNMSFGNGFGTTLPASYTPSLPEVDPDDGSAIGPWSGEATRSFIAMAEISQIMVQELRATDSSPTTTDQFLDCLQEWETRNAQALLPRCPSNSKLLREQDIYPWVLSTSANISKCAAILVCLRPAALAFQLGADEGQDWSPHIRHSLARKFRPSYSTWIATQKAAHSMVGIVEKTPYHVLTRIPLLSIMGFTAIALSFQTLLHSADMNVSNEAVNMLSKLCSRMSTSNPWGMGLLFDRITGFCLHFATLYMQHNSESVFAPIIERSKRRENTCEAEKTEFMCAPKQAQLTVEDEKLDKNQYERPSSNSYGCEGLFMDHRLSNEPNLRKRDCSQPARADEITIWDFKEVQLSLMGPIYEVKRFISHHLDIPQEVYDP